METRENKQKWLGIAVVLWGVLFLGTRSAGQQAIANENEPAMKVKELTQTSAGGQIGTTDFRDVGVFLTVTPHVTRDNKIRMHIVPEFSMVTGDVLVGGLRQTAVNQTIDKIPLLGDIPILGFLFRFEGDETVFQELMIFITPRIMKDLRLTDKQKQHYDDTTFDFPPLEPTMREKVGELRDKILGPRKE